MCVNGHKLDKYMIMPVFFLGSPTGVKTEHGTTGHSCL